MNPFTRGTKNLEKIFVIISNICGELVLSKTISKEGQRDLDRLIRDGHIIQDGDFIIPITNYFSVLSEISGGEKIPWYAIYAANNSKLNVKDFAWAKSLTSEKGN